MPLSLTTKSRDSTSRPTPNNAKAPEDVVFGQHRHPQAVENRIGTRCVEADVEADDHSALAIDAKRQPRTAQYQLGDLADQQNVDRRVVDLVPLQDVLDLDGIESRLQFLLGEALAHTCCEHDAVVQLLEPPIDRCPTGRLRQLFGRHARFGCFGVDSLVLPPDCLADGLSWLTLNGEEDLQTSFFKDAVLLLKPGT